MTSPLLAVHNLAVTFPTSQGAAHAVESVSFQMAPQDVLGLVGESGCGKSMTSLALLGLIPKPGRISQGEIWFRGERLDQLSEKAYQKLRGAEMALIPQDPLTSLNPVYTIGNQLCEVLMLHQGLGQADAERAAVSLLDRVKLPNAKDRLKAYPHEFSGGMRQRVMIAMALSCKPALLIADEPTTALDVTVQAQILALLREIQREDEMAILLITHDLGVVAELCNRVAIMYAGAIVEEAPVTALFAAPHHPYTKGLLNSLPRPGLTRLAPIPGQPPSLTERPAGCTFAPRCPDVFDACQARPHLTACGTAHDVACFLYEATDAVSGRVK